MNLTPYLIRGLATGGQFALVAIGYTVSSGMSMRPAISFWR